MDTQIPSPIPFNDFALQYIPLPDNYPILPLAPGDYQPAAYTQGNAATIYVTIVIPLPGKTFIELPAGIIYSVDESSHIFTCGLQLTIDEDSDDLGRLAIINFSINLSPGMSCHARWEIAVNEPEHGGTGDNSGSLGKVVMDANILPTLEDPAKA